MEPPFSQGVGYGVIIGLGVFFAVLMNGVTYIQNKFTSHHSGRTDEFTAASRNIPFGLMVVSILSSWTWSLTLLQSATETYNIGISGSYWYAVGGIIQVSVFSIIASKVKSNANLVTTFPEMGYFRFGTAGHLAFLWCGFVCNAIVSACILLGGAGVITAITGMNIYAALFLVPLGCAVYVAFGGLRATFISDATHTFILLIFLLVFIFYIYTGGDKIGSPDKMYDLLTELVKTEPVEGNFKGSYLTFRSKEGGIFSIISVITGFGLVALDQAYWSRAIASSPLKTSSAYFVGACAWFVIPFSMGTGLGLAARACSLEPDFPSLSKDEISAGLASVAAAGYVLGKGGYVMILLSVFLSVTSSFSGELIAASTLMSFDIYKKYIKKDATSKQVLLAAKIGVFIWALFAFALSSAFHAGGISMGWLFNFLGCATASGVLPVTLTFTWKKLNVYGAVGGAVGGMILAIIAWLVMCKAYLGEINLDNLSNTWVSFTGNVTALALGGVISIGASLIKPDNFDWDKTRNHSILNTEQKQGVVIAEVTHYSVGENAEKADSKDEAPVDIHEGEFLSDGDDPVPEEIEFVQLKRKFKKYVTLSLILAFTIAILIPVPQAASPYIYSRGFFKFTIAGIMIWLFGTFSVAIIYPLFEARVYLTKLFLHVTGIRKGEFST